MVIRLLVIDEKRNSYVLELSEQEFKHLRIQKEKIKKHQKRIELNKTVTDFLNSFKKSDNLENG